MASTKKRLKNIAVASGLRLRVSKGKLQGDEKTQALVPGNPVKRLMAGGERHIYRVSLDAHQFFRVVVDYKGIDVIVRLAGPGGGLISEVNSPNGRGETESVWAVAEASGLYQLEVRAVEQEGAGHYEARIVEVRTATEQDKKRFAIQSALTSIWQEADRMLKEMTVEARRRAIKKLEEALPLCASLGDRTAEIRTLYRLGITHSYLGDKHKALDYYERVLQLHRADNNRVGEAALLQYLGTVHSTLGDLPATLRYYGQSLEIYRAVGQPEREAYLLRKIGLTYSLLGEMQKAHEHFSQALALAQAHDDRQAVAEALDEVGTFHDMLGDSQTALDYFNQALAIFHALGSASNEAIILNKLGLVHRAEGEVQKALSYHERALVLWRSLQQNSRWARLREAMTLSYIGEAHRVTGDSQKALAYFNQALTIRRTFGDKRRVAWTHDLIGSTYASRNELSKALEHFGQAVELYEAAGARAARARTLNLIGMAYNSAGEHQKALDYHRQSLAFWREVGDREDEAPTLLLIARAERGRGRLQAARARAEEALSIIETTRAQIASKELRATYFSTVQQYYEFYIDLLWQLHTESPAAGHDRAAFEASERARARSMLELLSDARTRIHQGIDPTAPAYASLVRPPMLGSKEIQSLLDEDTLLLEYKLGEKRSFLWLLTPNSISGFELAPKAEIEQAARRVYNLLTARNQKPTSAETAEQMRKRLEESESQYAQEAARLSRMLLSPVASQLSGKRLVIISEGALQYIPYGALPSPADAQTPLIVGHEIVSLPSASVLAELRRQAAQRKPARKAIAVIADPVFDRGDARVQAQTKSSLPEQSTHAKIRFSKAAPSNKPSPPFVSSEIERALVEAGASADGARLPRLPFSRREAEKILASAPAGDSLAALNFKASRATVAGEELKNYRVVHFATHGLLNSRHPERSGIVLSLVDERGKPQDGFLRLHEIYNLHLQADLVVLSACQTGLGREIRGEGLVGLVRGFMYAGSPRVAASLWKVDDAATAELMARFYRLLLKEGQRPSAALRAAQIEMWNQNSWRAPYHWAAFVLQGEWR